MLTVFDRIPKILWKLAATFYLRQKTETSTKITTEARVGVELVLCFISLYFICLSLFFFCFVLLCFVLTVVVVVSLSLWCLRRNWKCIFNDTLHVKISRTVHQLIKSTRGWKLPQSANWVQEVRTKNLKGISGYLDIGDINMAQKGFTRKNRFKRMNRKFD